MKASNFRYVRPHTLKEALEILSQESGAVPIAGGQSLLAGLNMRLSAPELLVDIGRLDELKAIRAGGDGIFLGALTTHRQVLESDVLATHLPLLSMAAAHIAHVGIRNRGTIGGSLAYADPAAELPACCVALNATIVIANAEGSREVRAPDFFRGLLETDLRQGEIITGVKFPTQAEGTVRGFAELARRTGDFAVAGIVVVAVNNGARIEGARVVYFGCVDRPKIARHVSEALDGATLPYSFDPRMDAAVAEDLDPDDAPGWRSDTKLHLAKVLTRRVLGQLHEGRV
jgi:aerobic carbon-monoxide dehydrogenase medium subunit